VSTAQAHRKRSKCVCVSQYYEYLKLLTVYAKKRDVYKKHTLEFSDEFKNLRSSFLLSCPCLTDREGAINNGKWQALAQEWHDTSRDLMAKIEAAGSDKTAKAEKNKQLACVFVR
jgi:hypothetical protein